MSDSLQVLQSVLKTADYSLTSTRRTVFISMLNRKPMTMTQLIERCPDVNRASVYRTVNLFEKLQIVNRIQIGWKYKLELGDTFHHHHHHITCHHCGNVDELNEAPQLERLLEQLANNSHFALITHQLEISGVCESCQTKRPQASA